jgi:hypothetical protein
MNRISTKEQTGRDQKMDQTPLAHSKFCIFTESEIQTPRSPLGLRQFVTRRKNKLRKNSTERHKSHQKLGLYKEFWDEIVPLSLYAQKTFPQHYKVQPVLGNQGYDANLFDGNNTLVGRIEITYPHDGQSSAEDGRLLASRGFGKVRCVSPGGNLESLFPIIKKTCIKKSQKDYSDCYLVIVVDYEFPPFKKHTALYQKLIDDLAEHIRKINFTANRVDLLILTSKSIIPIL